MMCVSILNELSTAIGIIVFFKAVCFIKDCIYNSKNRCCLL